MKLTLKRGTTSQILQVFILDATSTVGEGLSGLTNASSGLTAYFHRDVDTTATAINLVSMTVGTYTSGGFKEIDATNMKGWYQFCPPTTALSATSTPTSVGFHLKGATNMVPLPIEVQLVAYDPYDTVRLGLTALPNAAAEAAGGLYTRGTGTGQINQPANGRIDSNTMTWSGTSVTLTSALPDVHTKTIAAGILAAATFAADTFTTIADGVLKRDWTAVTGEASRSCLNAFRFLRNKWSISAGTLTVTKEDDSTSAWTGTVVTTAGNPVSQIDPT